MLFSINNESKKIEKLYYKYRKLMFAEAYQILDDEALAEDAVSEAFVRIMKNIDKIDEDNSTRTRNFLIVICRNVAKDIHSKQKRENGAVQECEDYAALTPEDIVIDNESVDRIVSIIENMDPKYKDVLILRRVYKMKRKDIAQICGISVEAVAKRLQRARAEIKKNLRKEGEHND